MWHPKINQILAGCGNGSVKVFFDPQRSTRCEKASSSHCIPEKRMQRNSFSPIFCRGAIMCVSKAKKKSEIREMQLPPRIITRIIVKLGLKYKLYSHAMNICIA
jgi:hypothetical protein